MVLYRPVGTAELRLIEESGWRGYPPRLPEQPIFYPVLEEGYAAEIASRWNAKTGDGKGYVLGTIQVVREFGGEERGDRR